MKTIVELRHLVALIVLLACPLAQAQELTWGTRAGGVRSDLGRAISVDSFGNSYITGAFEGEATFDGVTLTSEGNGEIFVAKYNPEGTLAWVRQSRGSVLFGSFGVSVDRAGNSHIIGEIRGSTDFDSITLVGEANGDVFLAKYDPGGSAVWAKKAGGAYHDIGRAIAVDEYGNTFVTGRFKSTAMFDGISLDAVRDADIFVAKYSADGSVVWAKQAGGANWDEGWGISVDGSGSCYVIGTFQGEATFDGVTLTADGFRNIFIAKYQPDGPLAWVRQAGGGMEYMAGPAVAVDSAGNVFVTGSFGGEAAFGGVTLASRGGSDIFVARYDSDGLLDWAKQAGGASGDAGYGVSVDDSNNVYVTGAFQGQASFDGVTMTSEGSVNSFIAKYDSDGSIAWVRRGGGTGRGISVAGSGDVYVTGYFSGEGTFDSVTLTSAGGDDIFVLKYGGEGELGAPFLLE